MTTTKKLTIAVVALSLVLVLTIGVTLAFLINESNIVTNTFTYGTIKLELTEDEKNDKDGLEFTDVLPGDELDKDPIVTVAAGSEKCYVYVLIDNQLGTAATYNISATDWTSIGTSGTKTLYRYNAVVDATSTAQDLTVFTKLTFVSDLDNDDIDGLEGKDVVISAYAHQSEHTTVDVADAAAIAWAGVTATTN